MQSSFNLVHATDLIRQRWKTIAAFTIIAAAAATITVFVVPQYYKSAATVVSANPVLADKARFFNTNIQSLYSFFGSGDDLDRIQGVADMDTTFEKLVDEFNLVQYYGIDSDSLQRARSKAVLKLRKDISFQRTEQGQLKIIAWTKQKDLSANLVNRLVALVSETETAIWQNNYSQALSNLNNAIAGMEQQYEQLADSMGTMSGARRDIALMRQQTLTEQLKQYQKSADEFQLAGEAHPAVLYVLEPGTPAARAERPDKPAIIVAAALAGFVFSSLLLLVGDRKTKY